MTLILLVIIIILLLILYWLLQSKQKKVPASLPAQKPVLRSPTEFTDGPAYKIKDDALLMLRPGFTLADVTKYFGVVLKEVKYVYYCQSCDFLLFSIAGLNAELLGHIVKGQTELIPPPPPNGDPKPVSTGELGPVIFGFNYNLHSPYKFDQGIEPARKYLPKIEVKACEKQPVMVAVLDTGLDRAIAKDYAPAPASHCMGKMGSVGYNMINKGQNTAHDFSDDFNKNGAVPGHGTPVTGMVLRTAAREADVKILPVKILGEDGGGSLLQAMCGIAYAKNAGAKIINASFGFYAQDPGQAYFFKEFIDRMTTDNTLIIAAAGNADAEEDPKAEKQIGSNEVRNLDKHLFYPAAFSEHNPNVITVTTVGLPDPDETAATSVRVTANTLSVAANQNYSSTKVQVGVQGDVGHYFLHPFGKQEDKSWPTWIGSSFAAPKFAGIVAATYYRYLDETDGWYDREGYLNWLCDKNYLEKKEAVVGKGFTVDAKVPGRLLMFGAKDCFIPLVLNESASAATAVAAPAENLSIS